MLLSNLSLSICTLWKLCRFVSKSSLKTFWKLQNFESWIQIKTFIKFRAREDRCLMILSISLSAARSACKWSVFVNFLKCDASSLKSLIFYIRILWDSCDHLNMRDSVTKVLLLSCKSPSHLEIKIFIWSPSGLIVSCGGQSDSCAGRCDGEVSQCDNVTVSQCHKFTLSHCNSVTV